MDAKHVQLANGPQELTSLVSVQPNAVVSNTLVNKPAGTVTLFAFDTGQGLSEHTAPYDVLVHVLEGEAEVRIATQSNAVHAGQVICYLPTFLMH